MAWTKKPELVATAQNIARSVPDRIVAITFLDELEGGDPPVVDPVGAEPPRQAERDGLEPIPPAKPSPAS
jgi:hypothetical protein